MLRLHGRYTDSPPEALRAHLTVPMPLWCDVLAELHTRGGQIRESGAFLLATRAIPESALSKPPVVVAAAYYDDLDADCLTGGITMSGVAYDRLWQYCREEGLRVVADVHTHPGEWIGQSDIDRSNPMMAMVGHLALIVGSFANPTRKPTRVGIYRYIGNGDWATLSVDQPPSRPAISSRTRGWIRRLRPGKRRR
jgi:proteasome lid subunit RPN8/RPN11